MWPQLMAMSISEPSFQILHSLIQLQQSRTTDIRWTQPFSTLLLHTEDTIASSVTGLTTNSQSPHPLAFYCDSAKWPNCPWANIWAWLKFPTSHQRSPQKPGKHKEENKHQLWPHFHLISITATSQQPFHVHSLPRRLCLLDPILPWQDTNFPFLAFQVIFTPSLLCLTPFPDP